MKRSEVCGSDTAGLSAGVKSLVQQNTELQLVTTSHLTSSPCSLPPSGSLPVGPLASPHVFWVFHGGSHPRDASDLLPGTQISLLAHAVCLQAEV